MAPAAKLDTAAGGAAACCRSHLRCGVTPQFLRGAATGKNQQYLITVTCPYKSHLRATDSYHFKIIIIWHNYASIIDSPQRTCHYNHKKKPLLLFFITSLVILV